MGNVPVIHEVGTACSSLGHAVTGNTEKAREVWHDYSEESVLGSGIKSATAAIKGDQEEARRVAKGMGRAYGQVLCGGGMLSDVYGFKELSKAGKSLGDVIGGGDTEAARKRWTEEWVQEYNDPGVHAKAFTSIATTIVAAGVGVATAGLGTAAVIAVSTVSGAAVAAAENAAVQGIDIYNNKRQKFSAGEIVGAMTTGAVIGGSSAALSKFIGKKGAKKQSGKANNVPHEGPAVPEKGAKKQYGKANNVPHEGPAVPEGYKSEPEPQPQWRGGPAHPPDPNLPKPANYLYDKKNHIDHVNKYKNVQCGEPLRPDNQYKGMPKPGHELKAERYHRNGAARDHPHPDAGHAQALRNVERAVDAQKRAQAQLQKCGTDRMRNLFAEPGDCRHNAEALKPQERAAKRKR